MLRAISHYRAGTWPVEQAVDSLNLAFDDRHRRRILLPTTSGASVLLDLPRAVAMAWRARMARGSQYRLRLKRCTRSPRRPRTICCAWPGTWA
ncbi:MAG: hypothetical protein ACKVGZ_19990, partial [Alphaproteobacteria bacterium]